MTKQEMLDIATIRYELNTNSFKKYMQVTIATNVSEKSVAAIMENKTGLQGIDVLRIPSASILMMKYGTNPWLYR